MIKITCRGADTLPLDAIEEFQGNLKKRTQKDIEKIIKSIRKYGFSFPFFVWNGFGHNYCLDGHGRIQALARMREAGEDLPPFPVVYIEAADKDEAEQKLLRLNSRYGEITQDGFDDFTAGLDIDFEELEIPEVDFTVLREPETLEKEKKNNPPVIQITFQNGGDLQDFKQRILETELPRYAGSFYNIRTARI
ncbi:MAG: ParB N-terminal domain-containing protein [Treponema sp.]|jgi:hypothetical protein|nr:ParB N-terminal domain-containing protein [Treponema sp.]